MEISKTNSLDESSTEFFCESQSLIGIYHRTGKQTEVGALVYSGGFQTRAGAHRKFVELSRAVALSGFSVFRFESRGLGDSEGEVGEEATSLTDIRCAIDQFQKCCLSLKKVIIISMCDGASAGLRYAGTDARVSGLILINPWISRSDRDTSLSVKKYYKDRFFSLGFWTSVANRGVDVKSLISSVLDSMKNLRSNDRNDLTTNDSKTIEAYFSFEGEIALLLSGKDIVAAEFLNVLNSSEYGYPSRHLELKRSVMHFPEADHTFSNRISYELLETAIVEWLDHRISSQ